MNAVVATVFSVFINMDFEELGFEELGSGEVNRTSLPKTSKHNIMGFQPSAGTVIHFS